MAQDDQRLIDRLNDLIALDLDAVNAYAAAIGRMSVPFLQERLRLFQQDHERHIRELSQSVRLHGGEPRQKPDVKGFILKGFTAITSAMGDEAALRAMQTNEELTVHTYEKAMHEDWPTEVSALIEGNYADERRHLAFVEDALHNRTWKKAV